jgi:hypothetical protein
MRILCFTISSFILLGTFYTVMKKTNKIDCINRSFYSQLHKEMSKVINRKESFSTKSCHQGARIHFNLQGMVTNE